MGTSIPHTPVRATFRVLAGFITITSAIVVAAIVFFVWRGDRVLTTGDILMMPLMAWFIRLTYHAAVHGKSPTDSEYWPFASRQVWGFYILIWLVYSTLKPP